jgi:hypothetical protein
MTQMMREQIEELIETAWELHDSTSCELAQAEYAADIMKLLAQLPENELLVKSMELPENQQILSIMQ